MNTYEHCQLLQKSIDRNHYAYISDETLKEYEKVNDKTFRRWMELNGYYLKKSTLEGQNKIVKTPM